MSALEQRLREMFDQVKNQVKQPVVDTRRIVVLSGPPDRDGNKFNEKNPEKYARIKYGILLNQALTKIRQTQLSLNPSEAQLPLVLNGEDEQLPPMVEIAIELGCPARLLELVSNGKRGVGNTLTQFKVMGDDIRYTQLPHLTFVTSAYHVPRVIGTAAKNLPGIPSDIIGIPESFFRPANIDEFVSGEMQRIIKYVAKGDIADPTL